MPYTFARLTQVPLDTLVQQMNDPKVRAHLPLLSGQWTRADAQAFVTAKEAHWQRDGLGHWAIFKGDDYVGWGGFQKEGEEWDFGLVLSAAHFGAGMAITLQALAFARSQPQIPFVTFLLPPSRPRLRGLERLGARPAGRVSYDGQTFVKFALETPLDTPA